MGEGEKEGEERHGLFLKIHLFIGAYIVWAISPLASHPTLSFPALLASRHKLFYPYL
jgi:hypothetical protein